jgi:hypothetical protein
MSETPRQLRDGASGADDTRVAAEPPPGEALLDVMEPADSAASK